MFFDNETSIKEKNKQRRKSEQNEMYCHGYKENKSNFIHTSEYNRLLSTFVRSGSLFIYNFNLPSKSTKLIRENANKALLLQIGDIDRKVLYHGNCRQLIYDFEGTIGKKLETSCLDEFITFATKASKKVDVTKLPIDWDFGKERNGEEGSFYYFTREMNSTEMMKKCPVISMGIHMINQNDDLASTVLVHEMTHALVNRNKGIIHNLNNAEVLSIYMELVAAYELDETGSLLNTTMISRLQAVKQDMLFSYHDTFKGLDPHMIYIDSALYAFSLFEKYKNGSEKVRKMMRKEINKTFLGEQVLEDTLDALKANQKEGSYIIQDYTKKLMK